MDDAALKLELRLSAIEYLLCKMHLVTILASGAARFETFDAFAQEFVAGAAQEKFPVRDPAVSDLLSAEWKEAISRLIQLEKDMLIQLVAGQSR